MEGFGPKGECLIYLLDGQAWLTHLKEVDASIDLMRNSSARAAGIVYLDHEEVEIVTSKGIKWKVYGTPVRVIFLLG